MAEYGILPTPLMKFTNEPVPIYSRVPYQLKRIVEVVRGELERLKGMGFGTSATRGLRDKLVVDYIREDLSDQIRPDDLWDSLGYGWTSDFARNVLNLPETIVGTFRARISGLTLGNVIALFAIFGLEECSHGPFHIFGTLWAKLNQGQALAILAVSGLSLIHI